MQRENRRLAAIVAADIAGYSRLIGQDEEGTLRALRAHRRELIDPLIDEHGGRIANTAGDSLLLEFPSVVDAVRCVLDVQRGMATRNQAVPADHRIEFRVGINIGDVVAEGDDILGDGVNVAARVQELAEPGSICISRKVYDEVAGRLDIGFEDIGSHSLKNTVDPVQVYRLNIAGEPQDGAARPRQPVGDSIRRSLAVVMFADVAGYGRLLDSLGPAAVAALKDNRRELWTPAIKSHAGRLVGMAGDCFWAVFGSAVAAVECAIAIQRGMAERNAKLPAERRMMLQIGLNIGELLEDNEEVFGDGLNIAEVLLRAVEPGAVAISNSVYEQVAGKLDLTFEDMGERTIKPMIRPIHVWRVPAEL